MRLREAVAERQVSPQNSHQVVLSSCHRGATVLALRSPAGNARRETLAGMAGIYVSVAIHTFVAIKSWVMSHGHVW